MIFSRTSLQKAGTTSSKSPSRRDEGQLLPILGSDKLLSNLKRQWWLTQIERFVNLPEEHFELLYLQLIRQFADFVQILPSTAGGKLGGLLAEGLQRGFLTLKVLYGEKKEVDPRFAYALFSAALLMDIGKVVSLYRAMISDKDGMFICEWLPYKSNMLGLGEFYKLRQYGGGFSGRLQQYAAVLLAKEVMPALGFFWMAENTALFYMWLALLNDDERGAGGLGLYLQLAKQDEFLNEFELDKFFLADEIVDVKAAPPTTQAGEEFLNWLKQGIEDGTISVNESESNVFVVPDGVFLSVDIFKDFIGAFSKYRDATVVVQQFNYLGLTKLSGNDYKFTQYFSESPGSKGKHQATSAGGGDFLSHVKSGLTSAMSKFTTVQVGKEGVLVKDPGLVFSGAVPDVSKQAKAMNVSGSVDTLLPAIDHGQALRAGFRPSIE